jgi:hypothetical protein
VVRAVFGIPRQVGTQDRNPSSHTALATPIASQSIEAQLMAFALRASERPELDLFIADQIKAACAGDQGKAFTVAGRSMFKIHFPSSGTEAQQERVSLGIGPSIEIVKSGRTGGVKFVPWNGCQLLRVRQSLWLADICWGPRAQANRAAGPPQPTWDSGELLACERAGF